MKKSRNNFHYAVRRNENMQDKLRNDKLLNSGINSKSFFKEINKSTTYKEASSSVIDDKHGSKNIADHFKTIYESLFNEQSNANLNNIEKEINEGIQNNINDSLYYINLMTSDLVRRAISRLKNDKSDESGLFTSDCIKAAPKEFSEVLANLFRNYLIHGHISVNLLLCALSPIVKDNNGDIASSKNYRAIAISSLILKILDICVLLLVGHLLSSDDLQFGFQKGCSTLQCTWAVQETIGHFVRNESDVFVCLLDFSKAFDKVNFEELFKKLMERKVPFIILKLLFFIYTYQRCYMKWTLRKVKHSQFRTE